MQIEIEKSQKQKEKGDKEKAHVTDVEKTDISDINAPSVKDLQESLPNETLEVDHNNPRTAKFSRCLSQTMSTWLKTQQAPQAVYLWKIQQKTTRNKER